MVHTILYICLIAFIIYIAMKCFDFIVALLAKVVPFIGIAFLAFIVYAIFF